MFRNGGAIFELVTWDFLGIWNLGFGIWNFVFFILERKGFGGAKFELDITELNSKLRFQACCFSQVQDWRITVGRRLQPCPVAVVLKTIGNAGSLL